MFNLKDRLLRRWRAAPAAPLERFRSSEVGFLSVPPSGRMRGSQRHRGEGLYGMMVRLGARDTRREAAEEARAIEALKGAGA